MVKFFVVRFRGYDGGGGVFFMCSCGNGYKSHRGWRSRFFAWAWSHVGRAIERGYAEHKARLFDGLPGELVEIGAGTGINFGYYPRGTVVHAVEPNVYMHAYLRHAGERAGVVVECREGHAEELPYGDESVDVVVSTLVLCSVERPGVALGEILRVLRPGGRFVFIEHVAAREGTWLRAWQHWLAPAWRKLGDGCNPHRDTGAALRKAGFARVDFEERYIVNSFVLVWPHILGQAVK